MGISTLWAIISIFLISLRCHPAHPWTDIDGGQCSGFVRKWLLSFPPPCMKLMHARGFSLPDGNSSQLSISSQKSHSSAYLSISFTAFKCLWNQRQSSLAPLPFGYRKIPPSFPHHQPATLFTEPPNGQKKTDALQLYIQYRVIVAIALHLHYLHLQILSANPYLAGAYTAVCAQLELGYGIMASSMPCLKPFMSAYEGPLRPPHKSSDNANSSGDYRFTTYNSSNHSKQHHSKRLRSAEQGLSSSDELRGGGGIGFGLGSSSSSNNHHHHHQASAYKATVSHRDGNDARKGSFDSGDSRRMIIQKDMVIKKEVKWSVERDGDEPETDKPSSEPDMSETRPPQQPNPWNCHKYFFFLPLFVYLS